MEDERMEQEPGSSSAGGFKDPRKRNILIIAIAAVLLVAAVVLVIALGGKKDDADDDGGFKEKESGWQIGDSGTTDGSETTGDPTDSGLGNAGANTEGGYGELIRP